MEIAQLSGIELVIASLKRFPTEPGVQEKLGSGRDSLTEIQTGEDLTDSQGVEAGCVNGMVVY